MKRDDPDIFRPETSAATQATATELERARRVVDVLEPLTTEARKARLLEVLGARIGSVTVVLDNPHDPHNGSAVLRSSDAFGVTRVHVLRQSEEFLAAHTVALGAERWIDVVEHRTPESVIAELRRTGHTIVVTHPSGELTPLDLARLDRVALVLGNEKDGVGPALTAAADARVRVPMRGFVESLNMSVAAALLVHSAASGREGDLTADERALLYARWLTATVPRAAEILANLGLAG